MKNIISSWRFLSQKMLKLQNFGKSQICFFVVEILKFSKFWFSDFLNFEIFRKFSNFKIFWNKNLHDEKIFFIQIFFKGLGLCLYSPRKPPGALYEVFRGRHRPCLWIDFRDFSSFLVKKKNMFSPHFQHLVLSPYLKQWTTTDGLILNISWNP